MSFDGESLYIANWEDQAIYRVDTTDGAVQEVYESLFETTGLAWDGASLWNGVLVGTESHDEATPYTGFVQQRDLRHGRTLRALPVQGVFAGTTDWIPGDGSARRMWWYDGYHNRLLELPLNPQVPVWPLLPALIGTTWACVAMLLMQRSPCRQHQMRDDRHDDPWNHQS